MLRELPDPLPQEFSECLAVAARFQSWNHSEVLLVALSVLTVPNPLTSA